MLEARNIGLKLGTATILDSLSLSFAEGEICLLCGRNGSGKTMLFEILAGLRQASAGGVYLDDQPYPPKGQQLGTGVGIVFQQAEKHIIEQTVEDEIRFGLNNIPHETSQLQAEQEKTLEEVLEWSGLAKRRYQQPSSLSGGELRMLCLASVIAMRPKFLLLDEPFENLDYPAVGALLEGILRLRKQGHGIVIITHDLDKCLAHADRMFALSEGRLAYTAQVEQDMRIPESLGIRLPAMDIRSMTWL